LATQPSSMEVLKASWDKHAWLSPSKLPVMSVHWTRWLLPTPCLCAPLLLNLASPLIAFYTRLRSNGKRKRTPESWPSQDTNTVLWTKIVPKINSGSSREPSNVQKSSILKESPTKWPWVSPKTLSLLSLPRMLWSPLSASTRLSSSWQWAIRMLTTTPCTWVKVSLLLKLSLHIEIKHAQSVESTLYRLKPNLLKPSGSGLWDSTILNQR
jgi:hypothetical protein